MITDLMEIFLLFHIGLDLFDVVLLEFGLAKHLDNLLIYLVYIRLDDNGEGALVHDADEANWALDNVFLGWGLAFDVGEQVLVLLFTQFCEGADLANIFVNC